jgi:threonine synthase
VRRETLLGKFVLGLACRACGAAAKLAAFSACPACGGPLDPVYDWAAIKKSFRKTSLKGRPNTIWRYRELLPLDMAPTVSLEVGWTPLIEAPRLAKAMGVRRVWVKCDGQSFPSLSFKDRPVAVAINKALELGLDTVACPSTGNLANAVAAHAAAAGLKAWIFVPHDIEAAKVVATAVYGARMVRVRGTYDEINRLAREVADRLKWGVVNVNLRPFYAEGSKTMAYEIAEQREWKTPTAVVAPMAAGALLGKLVRGFSELKQLGWTKGRVPRVYGAQGAACAPIASAVQSGRIERIARIERIGTTVAKSLAIGDPVDGPWAAQAILETGGWAESATDAEVIEGIALLAETTGLFAETAGGVTVAVARKLARLGRLTKKDDVAVCITGNGLKTCEALHGALAEPPVIAPTFKDLEKLLS